MNLSSVLFIIFLHNKQAAFMGFKARRTCIGSLEPGHRYCWQMVRQTDRRRCVYIEEEKENEEIK